MKNLKRNAMKKYLEAKDRVRKVLGNERGDSGPIIGIIFAAIIILGVLAMDPTIRAVFTTLATNFSNWLDGKTTALFS